jgi:ribonuclease R
MQERGHPMQRKDIAEALNVLTDDSLEILRRRLLAMVNSGQLVKNRRGAYGLPKRMDLIAGRIVAHRDGFGFLVPDEGGDDLYLSPRNMRRVMHGDRVLAAVTGVDRRGRKEGTIHEVLDRAHSVIVGRFVEESGVALVVPDNPRITQDVLIPLQHVHAAKPGQIVVVALTEQPGEHKPPVGRVVEILGTVGAPGMATEIAIRNFALPHDWPDGVEQEAAAFGDSVPVEWISGRKDLRDLPLVTIDGADARDFDDAVFARRQRKGWRLLVAIADVSTYVTPGSALDAEALERGTSVYFPNRVIPMLPEALSNGLCSLRPNEDRLCLACDMSVDGEGRVTRARFVAGVMHSKARLTYNQVWAYLDTGKRGRGLDQPEVRRNLDDLYELYQVLRQARLQRGAIDFESQEVRFQFDADGSVSGLLTAERNDAHKLIEECMILANVEAARFVLRKKLPAPFRVHAPPPDLKVEALLQFLQEQGIRPGFRDQPTPADFERIVEQVRGRPDEKLIMAVLLRSQSLAVYRADNEGHFGLALEAYSHFTSPIRRYPDLMLHRVIHQAIRQDGQGERVYTRAQAERLCEQSSLAERRAEEASRDVDDRLKCIYMERHLGEVFDGMVSGVTSFGLFVELDLGAVNGLVHVTSLPNDYYHFDPVSHRLSGERTRRTFQLADRVKVRVTGVDVTDRKIDFELVE